MQIQNLIIINLLRQITIPFFTLVELLQGSSIYIGYLTLYSQHTLHENALEVPHHRTLPSPNETNDAKSELP
jgi:hypothetical protein